MTIDINIDELIAEFSLPQNLADHIVQSSVDLVTQEIYRNWILQASKNLHSTRNEYINNINIIDNSKYSKTIYLSGKLPLMLERGISAFDMKENFKKSGKVKYSTTKDKNGNMKMSWYLTIPFRHGTPGIVGENSAFSNIMPKSIHQIVKNKQDGSGLKAKEIPSPHNIPSSRKEIKLPNRTIPEYRHKTSIYQGIVKKTAAYGKTTQNTYVSFRRVGEKSSAESWIHSGIMAHNLMSKAIKSTNVDIIVNNNVDEILDSLNYGQ